MKKPKKFVDIDCNAMVEPLYKRMGFDSDEDWLKHSLYEKRDFLYRKLKEKIDALSDEEKVIDDKSIEDKKDLIKRFLIDADDEWYRAYMKRYEESLDMSDDELQKFMAKKLDDFLNA
ncbi:hypothetical protein VB891_001441 [Vibrio cholerae]|nr:hypothetical protein [Vibrio cholerae]